MNLFDDLKARGLVHDFTDAPELSAALEKGGMTLYCGFDPTSDSLHIGSLLPITGLMRFQCAGHRPLALVGGATGMIGDPSGKSEERNLLDAGTLAANNAGIRAQLEGFLDLGPGPAAAKMMNNADWFDGMNLVEFLRGAGKHFPVGYMMAKESVKARVADAGISYTEFSYMVLQAYDFLHLFETEGCTLQIGGSDQWGNITGGIEFIRRSLGKSVYGITFPLITTSDGRKFGKTEEGNIWLDSKRTSPYRFYQYWIQTADADVGRFLRYFTFLTLDEIESIENEHKEAPEKRGGQARLALELTSLVHGAEVAESNIRAARILFGGPLDGVEERDLLAAAAEMPRTARSGAPPLLLVDVLVESGLSKSRSMARKDLTGGGIYVNNNRIGEEGAEISADDLLFGRYVLLRKGKKNYHLLEMNT
ncbi:MAG TPA: tyrosine--tRNA ligase [Nitrospinota bacterium]|jgi:tyrosyl-tRNA synthetase|nr:tyrosine--tRNA ligase [Nitrospinota bacterium]MDP7663245.1 tyrosine--tRNA ligase [Nitrospinota bacterium]HJP13681.1 tyrosine--tRNA ligase [Nitrospinota bacterium]